MIGKNNYYSSILGTMPEPVNQKFVPLNFNPRVPNHTNTFLSIQPSEVWRRFLTTGIRSVQRIILHRPSGVSMVGNAASMHTTPISRIAWEGHLTDSGLQNFAQRR